MKSMADIDECETDPGICGPEAVCENTVGSYTCTCYVGYSVSPEGSMASATNPCQGPSFSSSAQALQMSMLNSIQQDIMNSTNISLPLEAVSNILEMTVNMSANVVSNSGEGGGSAEVGSVLLKISEKLVSTFVPHTQTPFNKTMKTPVLEADIQTIGPERPSNLTAVHLLAVKENIVSINLSAVADKSNGSAALMFMSLTGLDTFLSAQYFKSENATQMYSDVVSATLLWTNNTGLPEPVNFTLHHKVGPSENGLVTCVYWEESGDVKHWSTEGCMAIVSDGNSTICTCTHLSTFAVILQTEKAVQKEDPLLEWVNLVCMCVGLTFLGLAVLTFLFCTWNPKVNNTARLHLSLTLFLAYLLFLVGLNRTNNALVCSAIAGLLHFLFLSSFVWMFLETLQLFLLVRGLTKVQAIQKEGLKKRYLLLIGYGTPLVVVGVSARVLPSGYGSGDKCWLNTEKGFIWSFLGPVCVILCVNCVLFCVILWTLQPTLTSMKSGISQAKDTRLIVFKILAQSIILGCAWILGFFQSSTLLQYLFVIVNSQQGTFIFIVHCLFNKEVREEYVKWLACLCRVERPNESPQPSVSTYSARDCVVTD
ncbi:adhesion G protein-coupled receptor E2-like [Scleropages formosus]|uniref:adhesion G protein-coupled receptor E2-like n=1 Tax=Scleropages formosus TaxID=113540 RepID=UPI0010FA8E38|nr:adhesion G protein-coupled receptor E2-like [Scleropages formosus]